VRWTVSQAPVKSQEGPVDARLEARLPKAGLAVRRTVRLSSADAVFSVREEITNENALGRVYNMVQHPTIAPPFLDEKTIVDCNGSRGFAQGGELPDPEEPFATWPSARKRNGATVDLRGLRDDPDPNVVSFEISDEIGWVTAANPARGMLIGYAWRAADYPWVSLWRDVQQGKPAARGLEFGTTGLHQPFAVLLKKGRIWDRPLFDYLDAGETKSREYLGFLVRIPVDFLGVGRISVERDRLVLSERTGSETKRLFSVSLAGISIFKK
jgi:hypothetical protein